MDSLQNCLSLIPKPPKIDMAKKFLYNRVILRFECRLVNSNQEDSEKKFLFSYYCGEDQLMIFLINERNSGFQGGKFLEKQRYRNDDTGQYIKP